MMIILVNTSTLSLLCLENNYMVECVVVTYTPKQCAARCSNFSVYRFSWFRVKVIVVKVIWLSNIKMTCGFRALPAIEVPIPEGNRSFDNKKSSQ